MAVTLVRQIMKGMNSGPTPGGTRNLKEVATGQESLPRNGLKRRQGRGKGLSDLMTSKER